MPELLNTVSSLTAAGFAGVGVVVFLLLFILLMRGKPLDSASAQLYNRFLTWGVGFAAGCGLLSLGTALFTPKPEITPATILFNLSPSFETRKLTPPNVRINEQLAQPGKQYPWAGGTVFISVDDALSEVDAIKATVGNYGASIRSLTEQRDALAKALPPEAAPPAAGAQAEASTEKTSQLQREVRTAIDRGDFAKAAIASKKLSTPDILLPPALTRLTRESQR